MGDFLYNIGLSLLSIGIKRALAGAGLALFSYATLSTMLDNMINESLAQLNGANPIALAMLGLSGMDIALSMVLSAALVRATILSTSVSVSKI